MKIKKILNHNAVIALSGNEEVVVTGLGLAYNKKRGELLEQEKIERVFKMENQEMSNRLIELVHEIPTEYVEITEDIVKIAEDKLKRNLSKNIYITLTDHISYAITRFNEGINLSNPMSWEIKRFYTEEFEVGLKALDLIEDKFGTKLPNDEAASIAMHIVNAELNGEMPKVVNMVRILQDSLNIIKYHYRVELETDSLYYQRLVTHLKFFAQRILNGEVSQTDDDKLFDLISKQYPKAYECATKIKDYAKVQYDFNLHPSELTYLTVHIERVIN